MKNFFILVATTFSMVGCISTHNGVFQAPNIQFENPNFTLIKTIDGSASTTYVFGLGAHNKDGLIKEAKEQMYKEHKFLQNQIITNITLDEKESWIFGPLIYKKTIIVSADIIQYGDVKVSELIPDDNHQVSYSEYLKIDDTVFFKDKKEETFLEAKVIKIDYPFIDISYIEKNKTRKTQKLFTELYLKEGENYRQLKTGK